MEISGKLDSERQQFPVEDRKGRGGERKKNDIRSKASLAYPSPQPTSPNSPDTYCAFKYTVVNVLRIRNHITLILI